MKCIAAFLSYRLGMALCLAACLVVRPARAASPPLDPSILDQFVARPLGPANMGGRVVDVAVVPSRPTTMYVATASGGLWKTVNNGTSWTPMFDHETSASLGAVAVAPSNPDVVWVGTGEANPRNSVSWGDGVYKSTDGGKTWAHLGLKESRHVGRILIHPTNPDIVYVAALGHLWGPNKERGLYKTTDGGKHWVLAKSLDEDTGFVEMVMDPTDPDTLLAAAYRVRRDGFAGGNPAEQFGPASGLYRTTDGGRTWRKLAAGLPTRPIGRCGLAFSRSNPRVVVAVIQTDQTPLLRDSEWGQAARTNDRGETGGVFRSVDRGETWTKLNDLCPRPFYFSQVRIDPNDDQRIYVLGVNLHVSTDGGKTFRNNGATSAHSDHHALWIDPADSHHLVLGSDGGVHFSYDQGATWEHVQNMPIGQFYGVAVDMGRPYRVYGGLQDNGSWGGPSATHNLEGITAADWKRILGADGFECQVDPRDADTVYAESQWGGLTRVNARTGEATSIAPRDPEKGPAYRYNWDSPMLLSPHHPHTLYFGGNHLFRSVNRGDSWQEISPDLTRGRPGPSADRGHTITTIAESPLRTGLLYVGTDDGRVWVSRQGGSDWADVSDHIPGLAAERWITRVECSHTAAETAYVTIDRHRNDDLSPYIFRTADYGAHWQPLAHNLPPEAVVHVLREDPRNPALLFTGTEVGLFVSLDAGATWQPLRCGLPTVAVRDLVIHPRDRDLVIGTHGRSIYVLDVGPLEEMTERVLAAEATLFDVKPAGLFQARSPHALKGNKPYAAPNPPFGASIWYYLKTAQPVQLSIADALGNTVAVLPADDRPGLHRVQWDLRGAASGVIGRPAALVSPGEYVARLEAGGKVLVKKVRVEAEE